jgi:hypothetical protein
MYWDAHSVFFFHSIRIDERNQLNVEHWSIFYEKALSNTICIVALLMHYCHVRYAQFFICLHFRYFFYINISIENSLSSELDEMNFSSHKFRSQKCSHRAINWSNLGVKIQTSWFEIINRIVIINSWNFLSTSSHTKSDD